MCGIEKLESSIIAGMHNSESKLSSCFGPLSDKCLSERMRGHVFKEDDLAAAACEVITSIANPSSESVRWQSQRPEDDNCVSAGGPPSAEIERGNLEHVDRNFVSGWAAVGTQGVAVELRVDNDPVGLAYPTIARPDVTTCYGISSICGFQFRFPIPAVTGQIVSAHFPSGRHLPASPWPAIADLRVPSSHRGILWATPNPVETRDFLARGRTTVNWSCQDVRDVEIRVGRPDGAVLVRAGPSGQTTVDVDSGGMLLFLLDVSEGSQLSSAELATCEVKLRRGRFLQHELPLVDTSRPCRHIGTRHYPKALVAGHFSFDFGSATAGDLLTKDVVCDWLASAGVSYDVALGAPFQEGVNWRMVDPGEYSYLVFCCGPFYRQSLTQNLVDRFAHAHRIGVNLSMQMPLKDYNPFDNLFERDSEQLSRPDLAFLSARPRVPVVGLIPVEPVAEFGFPGAHEKVNSIIREFLSNKEASVVEIDTRLDTNFTGLRSSAEVESLIAKMDLVITMRLHGAVLAIKNGIPPIVIDPHMRPAKVMRQAETVAWPVKFTGADLTHQKLEGAFQYCLTEEAKIIAAQCSQTARELLSNISCEFKSAVLHQEA